jgi:vacuolar-type H+-ATPase subunit E/Vma4
MKLEEKLDHFSQVTLNSTREKCDKNFDEHKKKLDIFFEKHKEEALKNAKLEENIEADGIKRKYSKEFTTEQLHIRRRINMTQLELQEKVFLEVKELFLEFFKTEDYKKLLIKYIRDAVSVARGEAINIYIDKKDESLIAYLEKETGVKLIYDDRSFMGGIIAEIPSKNILIDNSFESKIEHYRADYLITF